MSDWKWRVLQGSLINEAISSWIIAIAKLIVTIVAIIIIGGIGKECSEKEKEKKII